jgi:hypothetical protein
VPEFDWDAPVIPAEAAEYGGHCTRGGKPGPARADALRAQLAENLRLRELLDAERAEIEALLAEAGEVDDDGQP